MRVIMFCFAGRQANMELQLQFARRILEQNLDVEYHVWNLSRNIHDDAYLRTLRGDGLTVHHQFYGQEPWRRFNDVYRHYGTGHFGNDTVFVKLDDDVVFIETDRFKEFIATVLAYPDAVVSANVVNNGACAVLDPHLFGLVGQLGVPLLDWHLHQQLALSAHRYLLDYPDMLIGQPLLPVPTQDWLSINLIGYNARMAQHIARTLDAPSPTHIAGRDFKPTGKLGDEGLINTLPRIILQGFAAAHLTFGPQDRRIGSADLTRLRGSYNDFASKYLDA